MRIFNLSKNDKIVATGITPCTAISKVEDQMEVKCIFQFAVQNFCSYTDKQGDIWRMSEICKPD